MHLLSRFDTLLAYMREVYRLERGKDPEAEAEIHLQEVFTLLAHLIEKTGDLPAQTKSNIRSLIKAHLNALGVESLEDYKKLAEIYSRLDERRRTLPVPEDYPEKEDFVSVLSDLYAKGKEPVPPGVMDNVLASEIAAYGQCDWSEVKGRGGKNTADYLYDLGKVMSSEAAYGVAFGERDPIQVGKGWKIENGRHRALTLRVLGNHYVGQKGMDKWIVVKKEG